MIISHKYRFIFVKCEKTAGTSLEVYLSQHCADDDIVTPIGPHVEPHRARNHEGFYNHIPAADIRDRVDRVIWVTYTKFCVDRNPWDKTLSHYHMLRTNEGHGFSFDEYLAQGRFAINHPKYTEPGDADRLIVDHIICYEHLTSELGRLFARLGVPFGRSLGVRAKGEFRTDRRPYREVYTTAQAELVGRVFAQECKLLGYAY